MPFAKTAPVYKRAVDGPTDGVFLTNRCGGIKGGCGRALTKLEILERMQHGPICPCGNNSWKSSNFKLWEELILPRSWKMYFAIRRGELPPPPSASDVEMSRMELIKGFAKKLEEDEDYQGPSEVGWNR